jgi:hypothetical protein
MQITLSLLREALAASLGSVLTPELAATIEFNAHDRGDHAYIPANFMPRSYHDLVFQVESFREILTELKVLHNIHFAETEKHLAGIKLDPDYSSMAERERKGGLIQFTARAPDGTLVGNLRMYVMKSMHTGNLFAEEDTFFLMPYHRKGFAALSFLRYVEECLVKQVGVVEIRANTKTVNAASKLMEYRGYSHVANQYIKLFRT